MADSFGPAQTRVTRTPIAFGKLSQEGEGSYEGPTLLSNLLGQLFPSLGANIKVDPTNQTDQQLSSTINHEQIHAILDQLSPENQNLIRSLPSPDLISAFSRAHRGGNLRNEIPAYMGNYEQALTPGVSPEMRANYLNGLKIQLLKMDPKLAKMFERVSN